jgi:hypothetical protein
MEEIRSKHYVDSYHWVIKVIRSCEHTMHYLRARQLTKLWMRMYENKMSIKSFELMSRTLYREIDYVFHTNVEKAKKNNNENTIS